MTDIMEFVGVDLFEMMNDPMLFIMVEFAAVCIIVPLGFLLVAILRIAKELVHIVIDLAVAKYFEGDYSMDNRDTDGYIARRVAVGIICIVALIGLGVARAAKKPEESIVEAVQASEVVTEDSDRPNIVDSIARSESSSESMTESSRRSNSITINAYDRSTVIINN